MTVSVSAVFAYLKYSKFAVKLLWSLIVWLNFGVYESRFITFRNEQFWALAMYGNIVVHIGRIVGCISSYFVQFADVSWQCFRWLYGSLKLLWLSLEGNYYSLRFHFFHDIIFAKSAFAVLIYLSFTRHSAHVFSYRNNIHIFSVK